MYIEVHYSSEHKAPIFILLSHMDHIGIKLDKRIHTTQLKHRLLAQFTEMLAQKKGRKDLLAFEGDILAKACELDSDNEAIHLACAATIVRRHLFKKSKWIYTGRQKELWWIITSITLDRLC